VKGLTLQAWHASVPRSLIQLFALEARLASTYVDVWTSVLLLISRVLKLTIMKISSGHHMNNHRARTWDHRGSKPLNSKFLPLSHHLDGYLASISCIRFRCILVVWLWLFFKVFFGWKCIKIIFFLFLKNYFWC
jgi:hypothetical protein